jgi:hypothetical protein
MNREQQDVIAYLHEENRILREKLGNKRIILNEPQKRRLATAAMKLGKDLLQQFGTLFSPSTLLKWHRLLVARKYDSSDRGGWVIPRKPSDLLVYLSSTITRIAAMIPSRMAFGRPNHLRKKVASSGGSCDTESDTVPPVSCISPAQAHGGIRKPLPHNSFTWHDEHVANVNVVSSSLIARC